MDLSFVAFSVLNITAGIGKAVGRDGRRSAHMAFTQLSARTSCVPRGDRTEKGMEPGIWPIFRALRDARSLFGLKPAHLQTLQALISFLRPGQGDTVFASNIEICRRIGGIDERTLRRHIDRFVELGFLARHDSPNGKRYRVRSGDGHALSFGLSLSPLLNRTEELQAAAEAQERADRERTFLRKHILAKLAQIDTVEPLNSITGAIRKTLRRKLTTHAYQALTREVDAMLEQMSTVVDVPVATDLPANDGQIVRHKSMSEKERNDSEPAAGDEIPSVQLLTSICNEAAAFASDPIRTWHDVQRHAQTLAPMMGIHPDTLQMAGRRIGQERAASAIFILLQLGRRVRNFAAYFHSLTIGRRAAEFDPSRLLQRLSQSPMVPV